MTNKGKACRNCRLVIEEGKVCPKCGSDSLTTFWRGYVVIIDHEHSEIAQKMGVTDTGTYALRLSR